MFPNRLKITVLAAIAAASLALLYYRRENPDSASNDLRSSTADGLLTSPDNPIAATTRPDAGANNAPRATQTSTPAYASISEAWADLASPLHNGNRSHPLTLTPHPGRRVSFYVQKAVQKNATIWYAIGRTANEASVVVATKVGEQTVLVVHDPAAGQEYSVVPAAAGGTQLLATSSLCDRALHVHPASPSAMAQQPASATMSALTPSETFDDMSVQPSSLRLSLAAYYSTGTANALPRWGGEEGLCAMIEAGVQLMNVALERARADAHVEFVGLERLAWEELTEEGVLRGGTTLQRFDTAYAAAVEAGTIKIRGDLRMGIPSGPTENWWGVAWLQNRSSLVVPEGLAGLTLAHELGHSLGMHHNRENASGAVSEYGFGFRTLATQPPVRTIMAYSDDTYQRQVLTFSDPAFSFQGIALGHETADNARVARESVVAAQHYEPGDHRFAGDAWLINESTRGHVGTGGNVMIAGFVIQGPTPKQIVVRGIGPTLTRYDVEGVLPNPTLTLFAGSTALETNDDWPDGSRVAELQAAGLAPLDPRDAAIVRTLPPGLYSVILSGVGESTGVGLIEAYGVDPAGSKFVLADASYGVDPNRSPRTVVSWQAGDAPSPYHWARYKEVDVMILSVQPTPGLDVWVRQPEHRLGTWHTPSRVADHPQRELILGTAPHAQLDSSVWFGRIRREGYVYAFPYGYGWDGAFRATHPGQLEIFLLKPDAVQSAATPGRFINLSTRAVIGRDYRSLIAGLVVRGNSPRTYLFRALGENLRQYGIANPAKRITVAVHDQTGARFALYTATRAEDRAALAARGMLTPHATDIAGFVTLAPGAYSFVLSAVGETDEGVGLVEVYEQ